MWKKNVISFVGFAVLAALAGCEEPPQIVQHKIPKERSGLDGLRSQNPLTAPPSAAASQTRFPTPEGWTRGKANPMFPTDKFLKDVDGNEIVLSIMSLPATNDWTANVQRWAGQVGMNLTTEQLAAMTKSLTIDGVESKQVSLFNEEQADSDAIVGIMATKGATAWFIKLMGESSAIKATKAEFDTYVQKIKLP